MHPARKKKQQNKKKGGVMAFSRHTHEMTERINTVMQEPLVHVDNPRGKNKPWVLYGKDNLFPQLLIHLYNNVNTHRQILNLTSSYIAGEGFKFEGNGADAAEAFMMDATESNFLSNLAYDAYAFNGVEIQTMYQNDGKIEKLKHIDFSNIRSGLWNAEEMKVTEKYFSSDWAKMTKRNVQENDPAFPKAIPVFNPETFRDSEFGQILTGQNSIGRAGQTFYTTPTYLAVLNWLDIAMKIGDLQKNNLNNGMVVPYLIHVYSDLSDKGQQQDFEQKFNNKFGGTNNAGNNIYTWSREDSKRPVIEALPNNNTHEMALFLKDCANEEIMKAHNVPNRLVNKGEAGGFNSEAEALRNDLLFWKSNVIQDHQKMITDAIDKVLVVNGIDATTSIKQKTPNEFLASDAVLVQMLGRRAYLQKVLNLDEEAIQEILNNEITE